MPILEFNQCDSHSFCDPQYCVDCTWVPKIETARGKLSIVVSCVRKRMDGFKKFADTTKQSVQKGVVWAKTDGVDLAKSAGQKSKEGVTRGVAWAKTDGKDMAKKGAQTTKVGLVTAANWTSDAGKRGISKLSSKIKR